MFDDKNLSEGEIVTLATRNGENITNFAEAKLTKVYSKTLRLLNEKDYEGHGPKDTSSLEDYKKYYGDKVTLDTEVKVIRFKV